MNWWRVLIFVAGLMIFLEGLGYIVNMAIGALLMFFAWKKMPAEKKRGKRK